MGQPENNCRRNQPNLLLCALQLVTSHPEAIAVIDGNLCRLTRFGTRAAWSGPIASSVVEFRQGPMCIYVREHTFGLLPGLPNLYCLDAAFRLQWLAEWPDPADPCARIVDHAGDTLVVESVRGMVIRLDANTGRLLGITRPLAVAS